MVLMATIVAVADILFILLVVPESLPDKMRLSSWGFPISWEQADPFAVSYKYLLYISLKDVHFLIFASKCAPFGGKPPSF